MTDTLDKQQLEDILKAKLAEISPKVKDIQGWIEDRAGITLYQLARFNAPTTTVVELGSWKGKSTVWLGTGIKDRGQGVVYAVDTWKGTPTERAHAELLKDYGPDQLCNEFAENIKKNELQEFVIPLRMTTAEAARRWSPDIKIGLLFIDASHEYEDVRKDFELWSPHVAPGGLIVFDDVPYWAGPTKLVSELPKWIQFLAYSPNQWITKKL